MPQENRYNLKKILIVGVIVLILAGLIGFYFIQKKNTSGTSPNDGKNLFPFGQGTTTQPGTTTSTGTPAPLEEVGADPFTVTDGARLRAITDYPITGFISQVVNRAVREPKLDEKTGQTRLVTTTVPVNTLRFNAKQNGFLIDGTVSRDAVIVQQKTKTVVPDAEEIWFGNGGNAITYRTWNDSRRTIDSLVGTLPGNTTLSYCTLPLTTELKKGTKNTEVAELQRYLREKLSVAVTPDGSFGPKTVTLLKTLQKTLGLSETGIADQATRDVINSDCASVQLAFSQKSTEPITFTGTSFSENIIRGTVSPDGGQVFFLKQVAEGTAGIIANSDGSNQRQVFLSPFSEWQPHWVSATTISMTTLASREADGYLYFLDTTTGNLKKILGPVRGLLTLTSPDAKTVLYSASTDRGIITKTYSVETGTVKTLDLATLASKCAWEDATVVVCGVPRSLSSNQYPDAWYQGLLSFNDTFWSINTVQGATNVLLSPEQMFDAIKLQVSPDRQYLYFINKTDGTLWSYRLVE